MYLDIRTGKLSPHSPRPLQRRWPPRRLVALFLILFTALAVTWSDSPVGAEEGSKVPPKPSGLQFSTDSGSLDVSLDWDDVDGAASYLVRWRRAGPGHTLNEGINVTTSEATFTVEDHGEWVVRLEACDDVGCGKHLAQRFKVGPAPKPVLDPTPEPTPEPGVSVPGQPTGLSIATEKGSLDVSVGWDDGDGAAHYLVRWRQAGPGHKLNEGINVTTSEATITVEGHGEWVVRLEACNDAGCGKHLAQRFRVQPAPEPATEPTPEPIVEDLAVSITPVPASPKVGETVTLTASITNPPSEGEPSYSWQMHQGGWIAFGGSASFSYKAEAAETWRIRITVDYGAGGSVTSDPVTVEWTPNRAPVVDESGERHAAFVGSADAPRGTQVSKQFEGIFSDPDGDDLTYTASITDGRSGLAEIVDVSNGSLIFRADGDSDWGAVDPVVPNPLVTTVTLTAIDPDGLSASVTGYFHTDWDPPPPRPGGLLVTTESGVLEVSMDWRDVAGATHYVVRWQAADSSDRSSEELEVRFSDTDIPIADYGEWVVNVKACNDNGCGLGAEQGFTVERAVEPTPVVLTSTSPCSSDAVILDQNNIALRLDCEALWASRTVLDPTDEVLTNWDASTALESWTGVTLGGSPLRVIKLVLVGQFVHGGSALKGTIPAQLGNLSELTLLDLHNNGLRGNIPAELGNLTNLVELFLHVNLLEGRIPAKLGDLTNLEKLYMGDNPLRGSIPGELGNMTNLRHLFINTNHLRGSIPPELGKLPNIEYLFFKTNGLRGPIPIELTNLSTLKYLDFADNKLSGRIPPDLSKLTNLGEIYLRHNLLEGPIPAELGSLPKLHTLNLSGNRLTGQIPAELGNLSTLSSLNFQQNQLTGPIPDLSGLTRLWDLYLDDNRLSGDVPGWIGDLPTLSYLYISGNQLTGCLPNELASLSAYHTDIGDTGLKFCD